MQQTNIWQKCPKTQDIIQLEKMVNAFLVRYHLSSCFTVAQIENWIYNCPQNSEDKVFDPILEKMKNCSLKDLVAFNALFRERFFPYIPQRILNGLSPVKYVLMLKRIKD